MKINIACCGIIVKDNSVLITKRKVNPFINKFVLPGGKLDFGENLTTCLKREIKEEVGIIIKNQKFFDFYEVFADENYYLVMYFVCNDWEGEVFINTDEISEFLWITKKNYLNFDLANGTKKMLEKFFNDWNN